MGWKPPRPCCAKDSSGLAFVQRLGGLARSFRIMQRLARSGFGVAVLWLALAGPGAQAAPEPERAPPALAVHSATLTYQLYTAGLHPLDFSVELALEAGRYDVAVRGETKGLIDFFVRWVSHSVTEGQLLNHRPQPQLVRMLNRFHGTPRRVSIDYATGAPVASVEPPPTQDDRDPVTPEQQKGTIDPVSAVLDLAERVAHGEGCGATERVFDGRRRFDILVGDLGMQMLDRNSRSPYAGMAQVCDFTIDKIAGFNRRPSTGSGYDTAQPEKVVYRSWSMPLLPGLPALPVRIRGEGSLGPFTLYLTSVVPGTPRPSMADLQ
jgi:hypothetical protein